LKPRTGVVARRIALALFAIAGIAAVHAAALTTGRFVEADGWKARITVDCLLKDKLCGSFRYETLACEGDLIYAGETPTGFSFRTELRAGRCLPGCSLEISSDFKRYAEVCRDSRHEGTLAAATGPGAPAAAAAPAATSRTAAAATAPGAGPPAKGPSGQVRFRWDNGDTFDGQMLDGKRNGKGKMVWANGQIYDGDWRDDVAVGEGSLIFMNGDRYQGQVRNGIPEGRGKKQFANGDSYEGNFANGIADGEGVHTQRDGSRYTGQFKAGIKHGRGKYAWASGQVYEGEWVDDRPEGKGSLTFANGGGTVALIPTRYAPMPESADHAVRLSRRTDWIEVSPDQYRGVGLRLLTTDQAEMGLLDVRTITLNVAQDANNAPGATASGEAAA